MGVSFLVANSSDLLDQCEHSKPFAGGNHPLRGRDELDYLSVGGQRLATCARSVDARGVVCPAGGPIGSQIEERLPAENSRIVSIVERGPDGVIPYRLDGAYPDMAFTNLQNFLAHAMAAHFSGRRIHAQKFSFELISRAIGVAKLENLGFFVQFYRRWRHLCGPRCIFGYELCHLNLEDIAA